MDAVPDKNSDVGGDKPEWQTKVEKIREFLAPMASEENGSRSRDDFMKRLATYTPGMWMGKPVSPPQCARYGWALSRDSILHCSTCGEYLCADLPSPSKLASYKFSCEKLQEKVVTSHGKFCSWPSSPESESVLGLPPLSNKGLAKLVSERAASIEQHLSDKFCLDFKELAEMDNELINWLTTRFGINVSPDVTRLVLTGWLMNGARKLACTYCSRSWFPETEVNSEGDTVSEKDDEAPSTKKPRIESPKSLNPLFQHQAWCAWRHPNLGWTTYFNQLKQWHAAEQTKMSPVPGKGLSETLRRVRQMLQTTETSV